MIQNIITLVIVFWAVAYAAWSLITTLTTSGGSRCDGCSGCSLKNEPGIPSGRRIK